MPLYYQFKLQNWFILLVRKLFLTCSVMNFLCFSSMKKYGPILFLPSITSCDEFNDLHPLCSLNPNTRLWQDRYLPKGTIAQAGWLSWPTLSRHCSTQPAVPFFPQTNILWAFICRKTYNLWQRRHLLLLLKIILCILLQNTNIIHIIYNIVIYLPR